MENKIRNLFITCILLVLSLNALAEDTLKIHITYKHTLGSEGTTVGYMAVKQEFLTWDGVLFREVNFNEKTGLVSSYIFKFYRNGKLFTEECYNAGDTLTHIIKHDYDANGHEIKTTRLIPENKGFSETETIIRTFKGKNISETKTLQNNKALSTSTFKYNDANQLISEKSNSKPAANTEYLKLSKVYSYNGDGKIAVVVINGKRKDGTSFRNTEKYDYNEKGKLTSVKSLNEDGTVNLEKVYKYYDSGGLNIYEEHDASGKMTLMLQYVYRKHSMEKGTQVSRYENL